MTFKSASIYASISTLVLCALIYLVQISGIIWIPSLIMQGLVTVCLFPIFTWFVVTMPMGRDDARVAEDGSRYSLVKLGARLSMTAIFVPLALISSPPVLWGNAGVGWFLVPLFGASCFALAAIWLTRMQWDDRTLIITSVIRGKQAFDWATLSRVTTRDRLDFTTLTFIDGRKAHLGRYMEGYTDVMTIAERHLKNA
ncbi:MAG: hypothetical protein AAF641_04030 [Pseudomonadota bacterium]